MKRILTSLREKKRYIVFEVISKKQAAFQNVADAIMDSFKKFLGEKECSKAAPFLLANKWNKNAQRGILRINHAFKDAAKACLSLIESIEGEKGIVRSIVTSGTLKRAFAIMKSM